VNRARGPEIWRRSKEKARSAGNLPFGLQQQPEVGLAKAQVYEQAGVELAG